MPTENYINTNFVSNVNMDKKIILEENIKKFVNSANLLYNVKDFTSATIIYFKSLFCIFDLIILKDTGQTPKDHSERFRILEIKYPKLYTILDKLYPTYRNTYSANINKEICGKIKENVERIIKEQKIC